MAYPLDVTPAPIEVPLTRSVSAAANITPSASRDYAYLSGTAVGSQLTYSDLASFAWWLDPQPDERARASIDATVGSLLESSSVPALEHGIQLAFFETVDLDDAVLMPFVEALRPDVVSARLYPQPVNSIERLAEYTGGTKLGRMADAYPRQWVATAQQIVGSSSMTAQQMLQALFDRWTDEFVWFTAKPVPDLRFRHPSGVYDATRGVLTTEAIWLQQKQDSRLSMRQIVDDILSVLPGNPLTYDSDGDVLIRATYGPDAPTAPAVTLSDAEVIRVSTGKPDQRGVRNRARVDTTGREFVEDVPVTAAAYTVLSFFDETVLGLPEGEDLRVDPWRVREYDPNLLVASDQPISVTWDSTIYSATDESGGGLFTEAVEDGVLSLSLGESKTITVTARVGEWLLWVGNLVQIDWTFTRVDYGVHVIESSATSEARADASTWSMAYVIDWSVTGTAFTSSDTVISADYGYDLARDSLYDPVTGGNAIAISQETYGEHEVVVSTSIFPLTEKQAQDIAQGLVLHYINPVTIRQVLQSWWERYRVTFDHIGLLVQLPPDGDTAEVGYAQQRDYTDSFLDPLAPIVESNFELAITQSVYTTDGLLAWDNGNPLRFEDGDLVEVS